MVRIVMGESQCDAGSVGGGAHQFVGERFTLTRLTSYRVVAQLRHGYPSDSRSAALGHRRFCFPRCRSRHFRPRRQGLRRSRRTRTEGRRCLVRQGQGGNAGHPGTECYSGGDSDAHHSASGDAVSPDRRRATVPTRLYGHHPESGRAANCKGLGQDLVLLPTRRRCPGQSDLSRRLPVIFPVDGGQLARSLVCRVDDDGRGSRGGQLGRDAGSDYGRGRSEKSRRTRIERSIWPALFLPLLVTVVLSTQSSFLRQSRERESETDCVTCCCVFVVASSPPLTRTIHSAIYAKMDEHYDFIILGTGLTECVLSGLLSVEGKKVLHMDRNDYYGAESASLNLTQLYKKFRGTEPPAELGRDRDYAIDLIPKFMMANGEMTKMLVHTDVTRYLEFKQIAGSYVLRDGRIAKVPATEMEAIKSPLLGLFEKRRARNFFLWVQNYNEENPSTHQGLSLDKNTMKEVYYKFGLEAGTQDFIGHAMALYLDDDYLTQPARETYNRIMLYTSSMARFGKSPYLYPLYGLGELPQGFARLSAIYGGTYMLDKPVEKIEYDDKGKFVGVTSGGETVKADKVIGDPSYFVDASGKGGADKEDKVFLEGHVVRAICILRHPIPNTDDSDSVQIIIPQKQVNRKHDIYVAEVSSTHNVCAKDVYVAMVSTIVETGNPEAELEPGLKLLGPIHEKFVSITPIYSPASSGSHDNVFITRSYDATSHFETVCDDVKEVWRRAVGEELVLKKREDALQAE